MIFVFVFILILSFFLTLRSMSDFKPPKELEKILPRKKWLASIIFFGKKTRYYSSTSSSDSSGMLKEAK